MIDLDGVSIAYGDTPILRDISLRIAPGEKVVIIGQSGAGKTTLLRQIFDAQPERAAFVHQDYALVPQLSVFHNICAGRLDFHGSLYNILNLLRPRPQEVAAVEPLVERLGMPDKLFERVGNLSGGQQQRVAVARAIYRQADLVLCDEPVSAIDPLQAGTVLDLLAKADHTVVLAMHDVDLALDHFERIVGLRLGRLEFDLHRDEVNDNLLRALYRPC